MKLLNFVGVLILWAFVFTATLYIGVSKHEQAHVQIFEYLGVNSTIEYSLTGGETVPQNNYPNQEYREIGKILHAQNEIAGYNNMGIFLMLNFILLVEMLRFVRD